MVALENSLTREGQKLANIWSEGPASQLQMVASNVPEHLTAALMRVRQSKTMLEVGRNAYLLELLFDFVVAFKLGGRILSGVRGRVHSADEFLNSNVVKGCTINLEVSWHFNWHAMWEIKSLR